MLQGQGALRILVSAVSRLDVILAKAEIPLRKNIKDSVFGSLAPRGDSGEGRNPSEEKPALVAKEYGYV